MLTLKENYIQMREQDHVELREEERSRSKEVDNNSSRPAEEEDKSFSEEDVGDSFRSLPPRGDRSSPSRRRKTWFQRRVQC